MSKLFENTSVAFAIKDDKELKKMYHLFSLLNINWLNKLGTSFMSFCFRFHIPVPRYFKELAFNQFCGGTSMAECQPVFEKLKDHKVYSCVDYGVEAKQSDEDFESTTQEFEKIIDYGKTHQSVHFMSIKLTGLSLTSILTKLHNKETLTDKEAKDWETTRSRVDRICKKASEDEVFVLIDAEESWIQDPIDDLADEMMAKYNHTDAVVSNTYQLYRKDRLDFFKTSHEKALKGNYILGAKIVRGAYLEKESERAAEMGYPNPICDTKEATDINYDSCIEYALKHPDTIRTFIASHNERSNELAIEQIKETDRTDHYFFAQLYGMSDHITFNIAHLGYRVAKFIPYGPVNDVLPYLIRRAQENSSIEGQMGRELQIISEEVKRRKSTK